MTDIVERLREWAEAEHDTSIAHRTLKEAADEIERLEHMQANLHGHIKRLEDENSKLRAENAKLRGRTLSLETAVYNEREQTVRAMLSAVGFPHGGVDWPSAALQKDEGE